MDAEIIMLISTTAIGLALLFLAITRKGTAGQAFSLWLIQFVVVSGAHVFLLERGLIDTFTSTYGLLTLLMLILVIAASMGERRI